MALQGFRSGDDRKSRLVMTSRGLVTVYRIRPQDYQVFRAGVLVGRVTKFKHWYPDLSEQGVIGGNGDGSRWPQLTRQDAIEWVLKHTPIVLEAR